MNYKSLLKFLIYGILIVIILLLFRSITALRNKNVKLQTEKSLVLQNFASEHNAKNELITLQDIIVTSDKKIIDSLSEEAHKYKIRKPSVFIRETSITQIDTLFVPFKDTIVSLVDANYSFKDSTKFYNISGKVLSKGIKFNTISFTNENTYIIGKKRYNLFYNKSVLYVNNKNPYTSIQKLNSVEFKKEPNRAAKILIFVATLSLGIYLGFQLSK